MRDVAGRVIAIVVILAVLGACSTAPLPSPAVTAAPSDAPPPTPVPASEPAASVPPVVTEPPAESPPDRPPADAPLAWLIVDDERHPGEIGGYTFGTSTSSAPWLPAAALEPVTVAAGSIVRVELDERATIASWRARAAAADDTTGDVLTGLGNAGSPPAEFEVPPPGAWVVSVVVTYGGGLGDGAYYWHVVVE